MRPIHRNNLLVRLGLQHLRRFGLNIYRSSNDSMCFPLHPIILLSVRISTIAGLWHNILYAHHSQKIIDAIRANTGFLDLGNATSRTLCVSSPGNTTLGTLHSWLLALPVSSLVLILIGHSIRPLAVPHILLLILLLMISSIILL